MLEPQPACLHENDLKPKALDRPASSIEAMVGVHGADAAGALVGVKVCAQLRVHGMNYRSYPSQLNCGPSFCISQVATEMFHNPDLKHATACCQAIVQILRLSSDPVAPEQPKRFRSASSSTALSLYMDRSHLRCVETGVEPSTLRVMA